MHDFVWISLRKKLQTNGVYLESGQIGSLWAVCNFGWSFLAANFDPGFRLIQKLDCFANKLKNPGFLWRISCTISFLATIICPTKIIFPILAHCVMTQNGLFDPKNAHFWHFLKGLCRKNAKIHQETLNLAHLRTNLELFTLTSQLLCAFQSRSPPSSPLIRSWYEGKLSAAVVVWEQRPRQRPLCRVMCL